MKVQTLINKLEKLKEKYGNIKVVIDYGETDSPDEGWYSCDTVEMVKWDNGGRRKKEKFINITWER